MCTGRRFNQESFAQMRNCPANAIINAQVTRIQTFLTLIVSEGYLLFHTMKYLSAMMNLTISKATQYARRESIPLRNFGAIFMAARHQSPYG